MENLVPDDHDPHEDASYAEFRFVYYEDGSRLDDEGKPMQVVGSTELHIHNVASVALIDSLLTVARRVIADQMAEQMFNENVPEGVRRQASQELAVSWLTQRLHSPELAQSETVDFDVPDDASELFG